MSQVIINAGGTNSVLNLPTGPLPTIDPLTGLPWTSYWPGNFSIPVKSQPYVMPIGPQPGTYDRDSTNPQANKVVFRNPA